MSAQHNEIIIAGAGGQGVLLSGIILAQSAMEDNKYTTWFPSYGAEIRGGVANSQVVIAEHEIASPVVTNPDYLIILNQQSFVKFLPRLKNTGLAIINSSIIDTAKNSENVLPVDASNLSEKNFSSPKFANIIMLGVLIGKSRIIRPESMRKAIEIIFAKNPESAKINKQAFEIGLNLK